jgi:hypothetical protein
MRSRRTPSSGTSRSDPKFSAQPSRDTRSALPLCDGSSSHAREPAHRTVMFKDLISNGSTACTAPQPRNRRLRLEARCCHQLCPLAVVCAFLSRFQHPRRYVRRLMAQHFLQSPVFVVEQGRVQLDLSQSWDASPQRCPQSRIDTYVHLLQRRHIPQPRPVAEHSAKSFQVLHDRALCHMSWNTESKTGSAERLLIEDFLIPKFRRRFVEMK